MSLTLTAVRALDLAPEYYMLTQPNPGEERLSESQAEACIELERVWLAICAQLPSLGQLTALPAAGDFLVPPRGADRPEHHRMLDTGRWEATNRLLFGRPMAHYPFGHYLVPDDAVWQRFYGVTVERFAAHGVDLTDQSAEPFPGAFQPAWSYVGFGDTSKLPRPM